MKKGRTLKELLISLVTVLLNNVAKNLSLLAENTLLEIYIL